MGMGLELGQCIDGSRPGLQRLSYVFHPDLNCFRNLFSSRMHVHDIANVFYVGLHSVKGAGYSHLRRLTPQGNELFIRYGKGKGELLINFADRRRKVIHQCPK